MNETDGQFSEQSKTKGGGGGVKTTGVGFPKRGNRKAGERGRGANDCSCKGKSQ